jgi:hypothetical protein
MILSTSDKLFFILPEIQKIFFELLYMYPAVRGKI